MTRTPRRARTRLVALALAGLTVIAACGGGDDGDATPSTTAVAAPSTTRRATTSSGADVVTGTTEAAPPTPAVPLPTAPFTGLPQADPALLTRPALVVKIDNHAAADPQTGLNEADVVYEEEVEGITRFAAVFQSQNAAIDPDDPDLAVVGPIRSARTTDIDILAGLSRPMLAWSGGNAGVTRAVDDAEENGELVDVGYSKYSQEGGWFRDRSRRSPHNLYANMRAVYTLAPTDQAPPTPLFGYRTATDPVVGEDAFGVKLTMQGTQVLWQFDVGNQALLRFQNGSFHTDSNDVPISAANVVVMFVDYKASPADLRSPEAVTVGEGEAWVFTNGKLVRGLWKREDRAQPAQLVDEAGAPILLLPGRTWVELPRPGGAAVVPAGASADSVPFP